MLGIEDGFQAMFFVKLMGFSQRRSKKKSVSRGGAAKKSCRN
jgi:hypothetical protein